MIDNWFQQMNFADRSPFCTSTSTGMKFEFRMDENRDEINPDDDNIVSANNYKPRENATNSKSVKNA